MILQCAWCHETITNFVEATGDAGKKPARWKEKDGVMDGICLDCRKSYFPETMRTVQENAQATLRDCLTAIGGNAGV